MLKALGIVGNQLNSANITSQGNMSAKGTLGVGGVATFDSGIVGKTTLNITGAMSSNSTLTVNGAVSSNSTLTTTGAISDGDGNLRDVPQARSLSDSANLATTDLGNFVLNTSVNNTFTVPTGIFATGQIISIVNRASAATVSAAIGPTGFKLAGVDASTSTATLGNNGVCSILFTGQNSATITGNVS